MFADFKAPSSILNQIIEDMFHKLEKEDKFNQETLEELQNLSNTNSLIEKDKLLELLKKSGGSR